MNYERAGASPNRKPINSRRIPGVDEAGACAWYPNPRIFLQGLSSDDRVRSSEQTRLVVVVSTIGKGRTGLNSNIKLTLQTKATKTYNDFQRKQRPLSIPIHPAVNFEAESSRQLGKDFRDGSENGVSAIWPSDVANSLR